MSDHYDELERRDPTARDEALFARLPAAIGAALQAPGWKAHLGMVDPASIGSRAALARLPVLRKSDLPALQKLAPPFGGFVPGRSARSAVCSPRRVRSSSLNRPGQTPGMPCVPSSPRASGLATSC
jgi:hypothetical protein